jgi:hypothetical protein
LISRQLLGLSSQLILILFQAYVKCELHVASQDEQEGGQIPKGGKNKGGEWKRKTASHSSHDPDFSAETMDFLGVSGAIPELSFVRYVEMFPFQYNQGFLGPQSDHATLHNKGIPRVSCGTKLPSSHIYVKHKTRQVGLVGRNVTDRLTALFCERLGSASWPLQGLDR